MPLSPNPMAYPLVCWHVVRLFDTGQAREFVITGQELREQDAPLSRDEAIRRAKNMQLQFNGFRRALRLTNDPHSHIMEGLEVAMRQTADGAEVVIQRKDNNLMARAIERAMLRQGFDPLTGQYIGPQQAALRQPSNWPARGEPTPTAPPQSQQAETLPPVGPSADEWLREGVQQTAAFEETLVKLGFMSADQLMARRQHGKPGDDGTLVSGTPPNAPAKQADKPADVSPIHPPVNPPPLETPPADHLKNKA